MPQIKLIAIHNFAGAAEGDLPFAKGDELIGLELTGQWWSGVDMNDKKGFVLILYKLNIIFLHFIIFGND